MGGRLEVQGFDTNFAVHNFVEQFVRFADQRPLLLQTLKGLYWNLELGHRINGSTYFFAPSLLHICFTVFSSFQLFHLHSGDTIFNVSWYKLFKVMSNVIIQVNKKLGRHYALDNEYTPVDFFTDSCQVLEIFRSIQIHLFRKNQF